MRNQVKSICSYCGVGCGLVASVDRSGQVSVTGDEAYPVNQGLLCSKGRYLGQVVSDTSDRLLYPEMRLEREAARERVGWDAAIGHVASRFKAIIENYGPDSVALYVSGQMLTEEYYLANKLMKGFIGSNNIDTNSRLCMSSAVAAYKKALGDDIVPACYDDIDESDCMVIAGANPAWCHPILFRRMERRKEQDPSVRVIVIDPRRTATADLADLCLHIEPGSDIFLYNAIARILIERELVDREFIEQHVNGFDDVRTTVMATSLEDAAYACGVSAEDIETAAVWIGESRAMLSMWAMGLNQSAEGVEKNLALLNLSLLTGNIGRPGAGPLSLTGQPNAMGGREVGGLANLLAAHRDLADPEQRGYVSDFWNSGPISARPGLTATEMITALHEGRLKAIWIVCTNPAVSLPDSNSVVRALKRAEFVVVQDISSKSDTVSYADVVLPAAGWLEKCGTMTNSERRVAYLAKLVEPPGDALPDVDIFTRFAHEMGWSDGFDYPDTSAIFDEHAALTRGTPIDMSGMSHALLRDRGSQRWPYPKGCAGDTSRMFGDGVFPTSDGKARLHGVRHTCRSESPSDEYPLVLLTGRIRDQWHTMTRTGKVMRLSRHEEVPHLDIHPLDADARGIQDGRGVRVESFRGAYQAVARVTDAVPQGSVFAPMHWSVATNGLLSRANNLTPAIVDPVSKEPDFKHGVVEVSPVTRPPQRIVVVGAGSAAAAFVQSLIDSESEDGIVVLGEEMEAFYNRILLPEYISGDREWSSLEISEELRAANVEVRAGVRVTHIRRSYKRVELSTGDSIGYDTLVLAMGSAPVKPTGFDTDFEGLYVLRNRADAERIRKDVRPESHAVVVGGGLLGVEMADALNAAGMMVTLLHRSAFLMGRVVDETASRILQRVLEDRGIDVIVGDEVDRCNYDGRLTGVLTKSGAYIEADMMVWAAGVMPCVEMASEAGLEIGRGVTVDRHMRTSDPDIYAIGEVAEFEGRLWGIASAARNHAGCAAAHIRGDSWANYRPSIDTAILKIRDFYLSVLGDAVTTDESTECVVAFDDARDFYKKCVVRNNRLVGCILLGDVAETAAFRALIESGTELDDGRDSLLRLGSASLFEVRGRLVCSCNQIGEDTITDAIAQGITEFGALSSHCDAGTACGSCRNEVRRILEAATSQVEVAEALT